MTARLLHAALCALLLTSLPGAGRALDCQSSGDNPDEMVGGRSYDVFVPANCQTGNVGLALVFDFHGLGSTKELQRSASGFRALAETENFVLVHPQGLPDVSGNTAWSASDIGFVAGVLGKLLGELPIDDEAVFITGHSNGAVFTQGLACLFPDTFKAAAPVAGWLLDDTCASSTGISVRYYHAFLDEIACYGDDTSSCGQDGGTARGTFDVWANVNGCTGDPTTRSASGSLYEEYEECGERSTEVALVSIATLFDASSDPAERLLIHAPYDIAQDGLVIAEDAWEFFQRVPEPRAWWLGLASLISLAAMRIPPARSCTFKRTREGDGSRR